MKRIMHKLSALYPRNAGLVQHSNINGTHHDNRLKKKKKKNMNRIEKVSGKIQHPFMIK